MRKTRKNKRKTFSKRRPKVSLHKKGIKKNKGTRRMIKMKGGQEEEEEECPICLGVFDDKNNVITLTCNHTFHKSCMKSTCEAGKCICPLCRTNLSQKDIEKIGIEDVPPDMSSYNIWRFKDYINKQLRKTPSTQPLEALKRELSKFLFTRSLPYGSHGAIGVILEFLLERPIGQPIGGLENYMFLGPVNSVPVDRRADKKYFKYKCNINDQSFREPTYLIEL